MIGGLIVNLYLKLHEATSSSIELPIPDKSKCFASQLTDILHPRQIICRKRFMTATERWGIMQVGKYPIKVSMVVSLFYFENLRQVKTIPDITT